MLTAMQPTEQIARRDRHRWCRVRIIGEQALYQEGDDEGEAITHEREGASFGGAISYLQELGYDRIQSETVGGITEIRASKPC